jgi:putative ABC transport system permease protein
MLKNYLKTALRSIWKNRSFSILNILGLAIGIACASFIFLYVEDEVSFNHNFKKRDNIYRIIENQVTDKIFTWEGTPDPMAASIKKDIPGIRNTFRMNMESKELFSFGEKAVSNEGNYADSSIISVLDLELVRGAAGGFGQGHSLLISETMAREIFGEQDPIGKTVKMNNDQPYSIEAVFKDLPVNSSFRFQWLAPFTDFESKNQFIKDSWGINAIQTYVETEPSSNVDRINKQLFSYLLSRHKNVIHPFLFSMNDWHLRDNFVNGVQSGGRIQYVHLFSLIAWIILVIACINFMNLSTAQSEERAKEIGIRKVIGANKARLIGQFIGETLVLAFLSMLLTLVLVYFFLSQFNTLSGKQFSGGIFSPMHLFFLILITLVCGLIAGSYPAFYLSSFNPINALKGIKLKTNFSAGFIRKGLVVFQFAISIMLIIGTMIVFQQIQHIRNRELGYNKSNLLCIDLQENVSERFNSLNNSLRSTGVVESASLSSEQILNIDDQSTNFSWEGKDASKKPLISLGFVGPGYIATMGLKLAEGRDFYQDARQDSNSAIISESMAKMMGDEDQLGRFINYNTQRLKIVGIVRDFLYSNIYAANNPPIIFFCNPQETHFLNIRLRPDADVSRALTTIGTIVRSDNPSHPFEYKIIDQQFDELFKVERLTGNLAALFAGLSIFISCIGLFGLAAYTAERRTKEIGIRKTLGASAPSIARLLSKDFMRLVAIAFFIAFPVAWWVMHMWLQDFEYRTDIHWWVFVVAGVSVLTITLLTVIFQALKAAWINPLKSLRTQ